MRPEDPRRAIVNRRMEPIDRIIAVAGGKGGIGKSTVASSLALALADRSRSVGLLDLDLTGPTAHGLLGASLHFPREDAGILPVQTHGIAFLSVAHFLKEAVAPLRGPDLTQIIVELLAITRWNPLDILLLDLPPGLSDTTLDVVHLLPQAEFLLVATPSKVVLPTVNRNLTFLQGQGIAITGLVENMRRIPDKRVADLAKAHDIPFLGALPWDHTIEAACANPTALLHTPFGRAIQELSRVFSNSR